MDKCKGITKNGTNCRNKARDINGFCHKHTSQSKIYAQNHPWSVISIKDNVKETFVKVNGIVDGSYLTSLKFAN